MTTTRILLVVCVMAAWIAAASSKPPSLSPSPIPAPSPLSDCSHTIYKMASCLSFLGKDDKATKPDSSCCSGYKAVLHAGFECICSAVDSSARLGHALNMTKASTLASACGVSAPPLTHCSTAKTPVSSPAKPPSPASPRRPSAPIKPPTATTPKPSTPAKPPSANTPKPSTPAKPPSANTPKPSTPAKPPSANTPKLLAPAKPPPHSAKSPAPSKGGEAPQVAPTPSTVSGSYIKSASFSSVIISMVVASLSIV